MIPDERPDDAIRWGNDLSDREAAVSQRENAIDVEYRTEALRAASRIVAASNPNKMDKPVATMLMAAEKIAKWLETGER